MARKTDILTAEEIDSFARKLKATVAAAQRGRALEDLLDNIRGGLPAKLQPKARESAVRKATATRRGGGRRRRTRQPGIDPQVVLAVLTKAKAPLSISEIASTLGEKDKPRVAAALRKLRDAKQAVLTGEKAGARWSAA